MTREELIEVMARAQCSEGGFDHNERMPNDGPRWGYYVPGVTAALAAIEAAGVRLVPVEVEKVAIDVGASLAAAISLLERGGERAAPSRKMFNVMLTDYKKSLARARAYFNSPATITKDTQ